MDPARKPDYDIEPEISPDLRVIKGGGETTPERGNVSAVPNQEDTERDLNNLEQSVPNIADYRKRSIHQDESEGNAPKAGWVTDISSARSAKNDKKKPKLTRIQIAKRAGIFGGAGGIIGIALFFIAGFLPIGGLLLNLGEVSTANRDTQNTILNKRLYSVIDSKMTGDVTSGSCSVVKVACRFSRVSNALLSRLDDYGIKAYTASGDAIEKTMLGFPNARPATYKFTGSDGKEITVAAKDFVSTLKTNVEFRKAFTNAYNMRYWGYADSYIKKLFYKPYDVDRSGKTTNELDKNDPQKSIKTLVDGADSDNKINNAADDAKASATNEAVSDGITDELEKATKRTLKAGDPILLAGTAACVGINIPGMFAKISRVYQMRQEIALAVTLGLTASSMLKSGDMSPETMSLIGGLLTATLISSNGKVGKSAMDASGMKALLLNDNASRSDSSLAKFIPGKKAMDATAGITGFAQSDAVKTACDVVQSPEAQAGVSAVEAGISATGIGAVVIAALKAGTIVLASSAVIDGIMKLAAPLIAQGVQLLISSIPPQQIADIFGNSDIENAKGEDLGNALAGGISFFFSNAALSTGSAPLTTSQLADYNNLTKDTQVAYAEQDRADRSPFDITSPYTFLGSIVTNYYTHAYVPNNTFQTVLSSIGYTLSQPLKLLDAHTSAATDDLAARCGHASEFGVDASVGVGVYGDICAGIPAQYLDESTNDVLASVNGQIDENSGQPTQDGDIQTMLDTCGQGDLMTAKSCTITNQDRANESIYMYDLRINDMLDGTNTDQSSDAPSSTGIGIDEANLYNDSTSIPCAAGTEDAGTDTGYNKGTPVPIKLCKLPNTYDTEKGGAEGLVNSRASGAALAMFDQMKKDLGLSKVALNDSFRTMAEQQAAYAQYGSGQAAQPGYSNHQMGFAFDINMGSANGGNSSGYSAGVNTSYPGNPVWEWLKANASKYHYSQLSSEGWHWSVTGG